MTVYKNHVRKKNLCLFVTLFHNVTKEDRACGMENKVVFSKNKPCFIFSKGKLGDARKSVQGGGALKFREERALFNDSMLSLYNISSFITYLSLKLGLLPGLLRSQKVEFMFAGQMPNLLWICLVFSRFCQVLLLAGFIRPRLYYLLCCLYA